MAKNDTLTLTVLPFCNVSYDAVCSHKCGNKQNEITVFARSDAALV